MFTGASDIRRGLGHMIVYICMLIYYYTLLIIMYLIKKVIFLLSLELKKSLEGIQYTE